MTQSSSNIFIFTGEDDFSLRQKINIWKDEFAKKFSISGVTTINGENLNDSELVGQLESALSPSLFASKKLIIARNCLPTKASQEVLITSLEKILTNIPGDYFLVFWQNSLDRRLGFIKNLLKQTKLVEFHLPHGLELNAWIKKQASVLGLSIDDAAIDRLAILVGRDLSEEKKIGGRVIERKEFFDLWQVFSELQKLATFSQKITAAQVGELVAAKVPENVFALTDEIVRGHHKQALEVLEHLMHEQNLDEKSIAIKLSGLISEQMRSQLVVKLLEASGMDQNQIAQFLGWSSGRVFVTLKNSANWNSPRAKKLLANLLDADAKIKSTDANPKLLLDLIIAK